MRTVRTSISFTRPQLTFLKAEASRLEISLGAAARRIVDQHREGRPQPKEIATMTSKPRSTRELRGEVSRRRATASELRQPPPVPVPEVAPPAEHYAAASVPMVQGAPATAPMTKVPKPVPAVTADATSPAPAPTAEPIAEPEPQVIVEPMQTAPEPPAEIETTDDPRADWYRREAELFAAKIAEFVPTEEIAVLIQALKTIPPGFLVTALREVA